MRLSDIDLMKLIPAFMQNDGTAKGLAAAINRITPQMYAQARLFTVWDKIDQMEHAELDDLAWELNVLWYDTQADIDIKRRLIKQSDLVYARLGTKWAVEEVVSTYFGTGIVREWWSYSGKPHHFKILSDNPSLTNEQIERFFRVLNVVKRESSWLDSILITLTGDTSLYVGAYIYDATIERHAFGMKNLQLYCGAAVHEKTVEIHGVSVKYNNLYTSIATCDASIERHLIGSERQTVFIGLGIHEIGRNTYAAERDELIE